MADDATINILSQKLEKMPLNEVDYFMTSSVAEKISTIFCFQNYSIKRNNKCDYRPQQQQNNHDDVLFFNEPWDITTTKNYFKENIYDYITSINRKDDGIKYDANNKCENITKDLEKKINVKELNVDDEKDKSKKTFEEFSTKPRSECYSPIFSETLPSKSKTSPNKRKRSSDSFSLDTLPIAKSCDLEDLEVSSLYKPDYCRNINRASSFDDELLRTHEKLSFPAYSSPTYTTNRSSSSKRLRNRPSVTLDMMSCKSKPINWEEQFPRGRKVKVIQVKPLNNKEKVSKQHHGKPIQCALSDYSLPLLNENNGEHIFRPILFAADVRL